VKSIFPRLVVVLSLFLFGCSTYAQDSASPRERGADRGAVATRDNVSPNPSPQVERGTTVAEAESLPDLIRRVKPSVVSILTYD